MSSLYLIRWLQQIHHGLDLDLQSCLRGNCLICQGASMAGGKSMSPDLLLQSLLTFAYFVIVPILLTCNMVCSAQRLSTGPAPWGFGLSRWSGSSREEVVTAYLGLVILPRILRNKLGIIPLQFFVSSLQDRSYSILEVATAIMSPSSGINVDVEALSGICG